MGLEMYGYCSEGELIQMESLIKDIHVLGVLLDNQRSDKAAKLYYDDVVRRKKGLRYTTSNVLLVMLAPPL